jgi:site-specific recombinase XerD
MHTLRHTAATLTLTNGVPVHIVAAPLGDRPVAAAFGDINMTHQRCLMPPLAPYGFAAS